MFVKINVECLSDEDIIRSIYKSYAGHVTYIKLIMANHNLEDYDLDNYNYYIYGKFQAITKGIIGYIDESDFYIYKKYTEDGLIIIYTVGDIEDIHSEIKCGIRDSWVDPDYLFKKKDKTIKERDEYNRELKETIKELKRYIAKLEKINMKYLDIIADQMKLLGI